MMLYLCYDMQSLYLWSSIETLLNVANYFLLRIISALNEISPLGNLFPFFHSIVNTNKCHYLTPLSMQIIEEKCEKIENMGFQYCNGLIELGSSFWLALFTRSRPRSRPQKNRIPRYRTSRNNHFPNIEYILNKKQTRFCVD